MVREVEFKHVSDAVEVFVWTQNMEEAAGVLLRPHALINKLYF
jgi:hypothetical protein